MKKNKILQKKASEILRSLEKDKYLIPTHLQSWWKKYLTTHFQHYLNVLTFISNFDTSIKILEIGSLPGHFTILLKKLGYDVIGLDINPERAAALWDKYNICIKKVDIEQETLPFKDTSFDIIIFTEILEHLRLNPLFALEEIYRVLKPGGQLILSTPNITPWHRLLFLFGKDYQGDPVKEFEKLKWLGHMGHFRLYSLEEIKKILKYAKFRILTYSYKGKIIGGKKFKIITLLYPKKDHFQSLLYIKAIKN